MSAQELENRKGCNRRVILFFVFAVAVVAAFLIIGLVKTCSTDHEEKEIEKQIEEEQVMNYLPSSSEFQLIS